VWPRTNLEVNHSEFRSQSGLKISAQSQVDGTTSRTARTMKSMVSGDGCYIMALSIAVLLWLADMERSLIWLESEVNGWACSNCRWRFPVPTLLSGEEAKGAYDRLAAAKFRQHTCETTTNLSATNLAAKPNADTAFADRARTLIKRGYKPKVAVELVLQETEIEHGNDPRIMEKTRADAEDFLQRVRRGTI